MDRIKFQQIHHQLNLAQSALNNAKSLLKDLESAAGFGTEKLEPGTFGKFMGDHMLMGDGTKVEIPANYASKSALVYGDKLKQYEENGEKRFKQVERVKRFRIEGILAKKEGRWHVVTSDGSYRVLDKAIEHFAAKEGDVVVILLPIDDKYAPFAAVESVGGKKLPVAEPEVAKPMPVRPVSPPVSTPVARPTAPKPTSNNFRKPAPKFKPMPPKPVVKPIPVVPPVSTPVPRPVTTITPSAPVNPLGEDDLR